MLRITWRLVFGGAGSMAVVLGMCTSVPGCCSVKDDGHHFKTGVDGL